MILGNRNPNTLTGRNFLKGVTMDAVVGIDGGGMFHIYMDS